MKTVFVRVATAFFLVVVGFILGLSVKGLHDLESGAPSGREVRHASSSDGRYTARVWMPALDGLGATVSQPYQVWIEGRRAKRLVLVADKTDDLHLRWLGAELLEVCYSSGQISQFHNVFVDANGPADAGDVGSVETILRRANRGEHC